MQGVASNYQDEQLTSRVNIQLNKGMAGDPNKQELPFKVLAIGDYSHGNNNIPLDQKEKISIEHANFDLVLGKLSPSAVISVPNELANDGSELSVRLEFQKMKDFTPEELIKNVSVLRSLLAMRNLLSDLKNHIMKDDVMCNELEKVFTDKALADKLRTELEQVIYPNS